MLSLSKHESDFFSSLLDRYGLLAGQQAKGERGNAVEAKNLRLQAAE